MKTPDLNFSDISNEFGASLGDYRLEQRLISVGHASTAQPSQSFPKLFKTEPEVEGFYRLLRNPVVNFEKIFSGHRKATLSRGSEFDEVIAIHDTTTFQFTKNGKREGLGWVSKTKTRAAKSEGFFGHFTLLAVVDQEVPLVLGVAEVETYRRSEKSRKSKKNPRDANREHERWYRSALSTGKALGAGKVVHVMDREGDDYQLFAKILDSNGRFVIRARCDRKVKVADGYDVLSTITERFQTACYRDVFLNSRKGRGFPGRPKEGQPRGSRECRLAICAGLVAVRRPNLQPLELPKTLDLNVVRVTEVNTPEGCEPIAWTLFTTEPIETNEQILKVIDIYRRRWLIEEYFKALKTGCAYERRQLESYKTLLNALAILIPIAWNLLLMRSLSRLATNVKAEPFFSKNQFMILQKKFGLDPDANLDAALRKIARMGGHLSQNGPPGWMTIGKGYQDLLMIELGFMLRDM